MGARIKLGGHIAVGDVSNDVNQTTAVLRLNGTSVGVFTSDAGGHAEEYIKNFLEDYVSDDPSGEAVVVRECVPPDSLVKVDVFITRSPCGLCQPVVENLAKSLHGLKLSRLTNYKRLRFFCATIFKGNRPGGEGARVIAHLMGHAPSFKIYQWEPDDLHQDPSSEAIQIVLGHTAPKAEMEAARISYRGAHKLDSRMSDIPENLLPKKQRHGQNWNAWYFDNGEPTDMQLD